jgi:CRP/FNR family transcriptional regulator, cyclic AMP receptor protein
MLRDRLKEVPFFGMLSSKELEVVSRQADELDVADGKVLVREGELGHEFFVVESGTAEVTIEGRKIRDIGPGEFFGEMALLDEERRTATVTATSPMTLIVMTRASFRAIDETMPRVHEVVQKAIAERRVTAG